MAQYFLLTEKGKDRMILHNPHHLDPDFGVFPDGNSVFYAAYKGTSMTPTLSTEDILEVRPYRERKVSEGDVIYGIIPEEGLHVVHRVTRISGDGIITKGDNCRHADSWLLGKADIKGRVNAVWRGRKRRSVAGGMQGLVIAHALSFRRLARQCYVIPLRPLYRLVVTCSLLRNLFLKKLRPQILAFEANDCRYIKLIVGRHVIGSYDHVTRNWKISPFFRPLIYAEDLVKVQEKEMSG